MESLRHYLIANLVILLSLAGVGYAQVPSMAARSLSLASPPNSTVPYASLTNPALVPQTNGTITYCSNCTQTPVCAAGGSGATAMLINNAWQCGLGTTQTSTVSINPGSAGLVGGYLANGSIISPMTSIQAQSTNGTLNPLMFGGTDIGAQINAAIATAPTGATVKIPPGVYTFTTTIQCPISQDIPIIIEGAGSASELSSNGTTLVYTGNGDAVSQLHTVQNAKGCELRDLTLDGSGAGANAIGFHFGGTTYSRTHHVTIRSFKKAGIELEDKAGGKWTERYDFHQTSIWNNGIQIWFHTNAGAQNSFMHSKMDVYLNVNGTQTGLLADGGAADLSGEDFQINGNFTGTGAILAMHGGAFMNFTKLTMTPECQNTTGGCTRFDVDAGSQLVAQLSGGTISGASPSVFADSPTTHQGLNLFLVTAGQDRVSATAVATCGNGFTVAAGATHNLFTVFNFSGAAAGPLVVKTSAPSVATTSLYEIAASSCSGAPSFSLAHATTFGGGSPSTLNETCNNPAVPGDPTQPVGSLTYFITNTSAVVENVSWSFLNIAGFDPVTCH